MARKKAAAPVELKLGTEDTQVINSADMEAQEAELLADSPEAADLESTEEEVETKGEAEEEIDFEALEAEAKPKRQRRSRKTKAKAEAPTFTAEESDSLEKEVAMAREGIQATMSTMLSQFNAIKDITTGLNSNLEKMSSLVREMSPSQSSNLEELVKPPANHTFITKFATAASLAAVLLSVLSLSLSQSARQAVLNPEANRVAQSAPVNASTPVDHRPEFAFAPSEPVKKGPNLIPKFQSGLKPRYK